MNRRWGGRGISEEVLLVLMAAAAILLAMSVVTSLSGGGGSADAGDDRPRASFVFETNGTDVLVTHYGGDRLNGSHVYVKSDARGMLGNFAGTDGEACVTPVPNVTRGASCRVSGAAYDALAVVWNGSGGERLVLDRRPAAPTPSPTPTVTPTATPPPTVTPTPTATAPSTSTVAPTPTPGPNGTAVTTGTPDNGTATPAPNGTAAPTGTATNGTATGETATETPAGTSASADVPSVTATDG